MSLPSHFRVGDVLRYRPQHDWCHDGFAIVEDPTERPADTYWSISTGCLSRGEVESAEVVFNLNDYTQVGEDEWRTYDEADRQHIPKHSGYHSEFYVRKGAEPSLPTMIENARGAVADAERKVRSAEGELRWCREKLAELEAQAVPT